MSTTAIYSRVSTDEQRKHGISLEAQVSRCQQYAAAMNLCVVYTGIEAQSAKDTERRELQIILEMVGKKKIKHLLIVKLDRLSRDTTDALLIAKALSKKGVSLHLVTEGGLINFSDPSQEMLFTMRAAMGQFERKRISLNTRFALARKKERGERVGGHAPFGFDYKDNKLVVNQSEQSVIARIHTLNAEGVSIRKIIGKLASEGIFNRSGKPFTFRAVHSILHAKAQMIKLKAA